MTNTNDPLKSSSIINQKNMTIHELIKKWTYQTPSPTAIEAVDRLPLTYKKLHEHLIRIKNYLNKHGIGRNDRIAVMIPNGPEMAVAFLSVASVATCVPLNPEYKERELELYLSGLNVKALIVHSIESSPPALYVANKLNIKVFKLIPQYEKEVGIFSLEGEICDFNKEIGFAQSDDTRNRVRSI
jgi:acyl-CoA synthetase (AMP-forming)/AMP-acid ligase II